ncbi:HAD family hydrolase [Anaerosinus massiliensis]|uniref:HAD family hydrolase n=1 Tax=Massilibacillus massiliensis TaxID=1806837 RepID=UPI000DA620E7|nr:HAD family hydrolase [Massilibacillus massiliensis]
MIKHVLFDLDGTLIHFDHMLFVENYVKLLSKKLSHMTDPREFAAQLLSATGCMIKSTDGTKTNADIFWDYFHTNTNLSKENLDPLIEDFYDNDFMQLKEMVTVPEILPIIDKIKKKHIAMTIATNPVFPLKAVKARLHWAGLQDVDFKLITSYENSHYCKPNLHYFEEIVDTLKTTPTECLMIGNNVTEDLIAGKIGIKTYLLTDHLLNLDQKEIQADYIGTIADLTKDIDKILC